MGVASCAEFRNALLALPPVFGASTQYYLKFCLQAGLRELLLSGNWKLTGVSSIRSFHGLGMVIVGEAARKRMAGKFPLLLRGVVYVIITYLWEFCWGLLLDYFNARSWDYSEFHFNKNVLFKYTIGFNWCQMRIFVFFES